MLIRSQMSLKFQKAFWQKILQNLAKDGVLKSFKGANGGFALNGEPENLSIKKIIECAEKRELSVFECSSSALGCPSNKASSCQIWSMFSGLQGKIDEMLDAIKLSDIVKK